MAKVLLLSLVVQASALSSSSQAQLWLREHAAPQADELAELKGENPEAYAIVTALLTKRSLGLLNPKDPSASFSAKAPQLEQGEQGPQAFAKFASTPSQSVETDAVAYPEASVVHKHIDNWNWKPSDSAADEDKEVQNVLGAVAAVAQQKTVAPVSQAPVPEVVVAPAVKQQPVPEVVAAPAVKEQHTVAAVVESKKPIAAPASPQTPVVPAVEENSYLKGLDLGEAAPVRARISPPAENSYLRGSGLIDDEPAPKVAQLTQKSAPKEDFLASFSWGDEPAPKAQHKASLAVASSHVDSVASTNAKQATKKNPVKGLMSWLDGNSAAKPKLAVVAAAPAQPKNPYMMDLE